MIQTNHQKNKNENENVCYILTKEEMTLDEPVNMDKLRIIRDNLEVLYHSGELGKFVDVKNSYKSITDMKTIRTIINNLYTSKLKCNAVNYKFAKGKKSGRMFSNGFSLQNISKKIRGCLSKDLYTDIDMVNCHIIIFQKFCKDNNIICPHLDSYVNDRECKLKELVELMNIDRDTAKTIPLSILNGGSGMVDSFDDNGNECTVKFEKGSEPEWLSGIRNEMKKAYNKFISTEQGKKIQTRILKTKSWNIEGSVMNVLFCEEENKLLVCLYKFLKSKGIETGTFVFDGLMIKNSSLVGKDQIGNLLRKMEKKMLSKLGYNMKLATKQFEDINLNGFKKIEDIDLSDENLSSIILSKYDVKFHNTKNRFYIFDKTTLLWVEYDKDAIFWRYARSILPLYIIENSVPNSKELDYGLQIIQKASKMTSIIKFTMKEIQSYNDSEFIDEHFNNTKGLFPLNYGKTFELKTGLVRDRIKEDYFTKSTTINFLEEPKTKFVRDYIKEILSTDNDIYVDYLIDTVGYMMTNENNLKRFYVMIGVADTGKSLFVELLHKVFGFLGGTASDKVFKLKQQSTHDTEAFSIEGLRYASISELNEQEKFNEILIKKISGGDSLNIRRASSAINEPIKFSTVLLLATNEVPTFHEQAFASRMRVLNFKHIFEKNPRRRDEILENVDSFFTEFALGAGRYYKNEMNIFDCEEVIIASKELVNSKNPITQYWEEQAEFEFVNDKKKRVKKTDIWASFTNSSYNKEFGKGRNTFYSMFMDIYKNELLDTTYNKGEQWSGLQRVSIQSESDNGHPVGFPIF